MRSVTSTRPRTTALAIGAMFAVNGFAFGSWVPRLPEVRESLGIGDAALGLTPLGGGIGGLAMSLASGRIVDRVGSRAAMVTTSIALSVLIPLIAVAPSAPVLFAVLLAVGALDGVTDVAQNAQAVELQALRHRSLLSRMHAAWSLGTLSGGLVASWAAAADVSFTLQLSLTAAVLATCACWRRPGSCPPPPPRPHPNPHPNPHPRDLCALTTGYRSSAHTDPVGGCWLAWARRPSWPRCPPRSGPRW